MYTDPNSLLSTVVQSAAAFVAIVAGFIISRLLALSAERSGLQKRVRDITLEMGINKQNLDSLEKRLLDLDAEDFLENSDVLDKIIESGGKISLTETMEQVLGCNRSEDELRPYWNDAITVTKDAFRILSENFSELDYKDLELCLINLGLNISSYRMKIYTRVISRIRREYEKQRNQLSGFVIGGLDIPNIGNVDEMNRYRILERDIVTLKQDKNAMETQLSDLKEQLKQQGQPQGVTLGIIFLAYFSFVGIVIPVFLLAFPPEQFTPTYRWIIFGLFISGLLLFLIFLYKLSRQLSETSISDKSD